MDVNGGKFRICFIYTASTNFTSNYWMEISFWFNSYSDFIKHHFYFTINTRPVNDVPYDFYATFASDTSIFEDSPYEIEYKVSYLDVDADPVLNQFHDYNFVPDDLGWQTDYHGDNFDFRLLDFSGVNEQDYNTNFGDLAYNRRISYDILKENWNGEDIISLYISSDEMESNIDTVFLPITVLPINDPADEFNIYGDLKIYAMDETTFYIPCTLTPCEDGEQLIHDISISNQDNFFRLHNDPLIQNSVEYNDYDAGKLLFKWDRTYDVDLDQSISEYFQPNLYYRLELGVTDEGNTQYYVLDEIEDSLFDASDYCSQTLEGNDLCANEDFSFMTDPQFAWAIIDMKALFFNYEEGFYDKPDVNSYEYGFYESPDSTLGLYSYDYIDYLGRTEYEWRVVAYNRWWDYQSIDSEGSIVPQNKETVANSDAMRFYIDLERPSADFSIIQNPLYYELYELYMITNEEVSTESTKLFINGPSYEIDVLSDSDNAFYYAGEFENGIYEYELWALDLLENGGISNYSLTYGIAGPQVFTSISSPNNTAELVIPQYSLLESAGFIISEEYLFYEDTNKNSLSNLIKITSSDLVLQSSLKIRFNYPELYRDKDSLIIGRKNQFGQWITISSNKNSDFIEADIMETGVYALFHSTSEEELLPEQFDLIGCYPNPFNPNINIEFSVPFENFVSLNIYDISGKKVKSLINNKVKAGYIDINWDGVSDSGAKISSGIYFVVLEMNNQRFTNKVTMLK